MQSGFWLEYLMYLDIFTWIPEAKQPQSIKQWATHTHHSEYHVLFLVYNPVLSPNMLMVCMTILASFDHRIISVVIIHGEFNAQYSVSCFHEELQWFSIACGFYPSPKKTSFIGKQSKIISDHSWERFLRCLIVLNYVPYLWCLTVLIICTHHDCCFKRCCVTFNLLMHT